MVQSFQQASYQGFQGSYGDSGSLFGAFATWKRYELDHSELRCIFLKENITGERKFQGGNSYVHDVTYLTTNDQTKLDVQSGV